MTATCTSIKPSAFIRIKLCFRLPVDPEVIFYNTSYAGGMVAEVVEQRAKLVDNSTLSMIFERFSNASTKEYLPCCQLVCTWLILCVAGTAAGRCP